MAPPGFKTYAFCSESIATHVLQSIAAPQNPIKAIPANSDSSTTLKTSRPTSLATLVAWNISKALEKNPTMNIKEAITATQCRMEKLSGLEEVQSILSEHPSQRHLMCALLAWEELGHNDAESLCRFIENRDHNHQDSSKSKCMLQKVELSTSSREFKMKYAKTMQNTISSSYSMGPVLKLPVETKVVMRLEKVACSKDTPSSRQPSRAREKDIMSKIDQACCLDSVCAQRLEEFDGEIQELRTRAGLLAKREAERVELLERAETAWRDLERGYQRRLTLAEEKEEDVAKQLQRIIEERTTFKDECTVLAKMLQEKTDKAEADRASLQKVDKEVCGRACTRLKLSEEAVKGDAMVAEQLCRAAQADRDLQFKEEQARRKVSNLESELESARALTYEAERALRAELAALRNQIEHVSKHLLDEAAESETINAALKQLNEEKNGMIEDLESCKILCEGRMQTKMDELKKKRELLREMKEKEIECRCKLPVDATVEVKRTPSLAALCKCSPEDKILDSCSCTSLRGTLLSNLLSDLFSGLQSEMAGAATQMPCQMLKCLEDRHNWDRASIVKTNLKDYFSKLLVGELDIAIATSIEKYHAKWVGRSCADAVKMTPKPGEDTNEGWQERAIEKRAQKLASQLAEQLFQSRKDELTQQAKDIVASGPPPCECKPPNQTTPTKDRCCTQTALYPCLLKNKPTSMSRAPPTYWHQALQDVTQIKMQIEDLKKASIKKEDLKLMENKFTKIIQRAAGGSGAKPDTLITGIPVHDNNNKEKKVNRALNISGTQPIDLSKPIHRRRCIESAIPSKKPIKFNVLNSSVERPTLKSTKKNTPTYSVNMCLCSLPKSQQHDKTKTDNAWKQKVSKDGVFHMSSSMKQTKPIHASLISHDTIILNDSKESVEKACPSNCVCFHKIPSNTSIDKLLDTLAMWKCDLDASCSDKNTPHKACCVLNKPDLGIILDDDISINKQKLDSGSVQNLLDSSKDLKTGLNTIDNSVENQRKRKREREIKDEDCSFNLDDNNVSFKQSVMDQKSSKDIENSNKNDKINANSIGPMNTTESEYMGAINLEKSVEEYCKCEKKLNKNLTRSEPPVYKCIRSSKCSCEKSFLSKRLQNKSSLARKERYPEANVIRIKKERPVKDSVLDNMTKTSTSAQDVPRMVLNHSESNDSSYQIQFLGVTLSNAAPQNTGDYLETHQNDIVNNNKNLDENYKEKGMNKEIKYMNDFKKWPRSVKKCAQTEDNRNNLKENLKYNSQDEISSVIENNKISKNQVLINMISGNYDTEIVEDKQTNISKDNCNVSKLNDFRNHDQKHVYDISALRDVKSIQNKQSDLVSKEMTPRELIKKLPSYQYDIRLEKIKNLLNSTLSKHKPNDMTKEGQSFTENKQDVSCVCCNKLNKDEANDLEENAFNLLEEYLKNKLEEFKQSSDATCITPDEEHKLFTTTLGRIRKLIYESTNQIACKCSAEQELTQGSWNRAYGLLQEYLKIKIQKVQCSCMLAEDNRDSILPVVLEKICNLIEYDFQRLKEVCSFKSDKNENVKTSCEHNSSKEKPLKDLNKMSEEKGNYTSMRPIMALDQVINTENITKVTKESTSQVSSDLEMPTKSCSPIKIHSKSLQTIIRKPVSVHSVNTNRKYQYTPNINYSTKRSSSPASKSPLREKNCDAIDLNNQKRRGCKNNKRELDKLTKRSFDTSKSFNSSTDDKYIFKGTTDGDIKSNNIHKVSYMLNSQTIEDSQKSGVRIKDKQYGNLQQKVDYDLHGNTMTSVREASGADITSKLSDSGPYIGYTVDCSCNNTLETCVCSKSIVKTENNKINNIWKESIPDETYFKKVSYILNNRHPVENITANYSPDISDGLDDNYLKGILKNKPINKGLSLESETGNSFNDEDIVLKKSTEDFPKSNTMTNTFDDNNSIDTACSKDEDSPDWCECCSTTNQSSYLENERLKNSIYFPAPLTDFVDSCKDEFIANSNPASTFNVQNKPCECDMVPICHVKMLVENIEDKLVTAKCTCDSLMPQVCPEHSTKLVH